ncbi:GNAT family N-acetyltransferase [Vibrio parahaemolyticus]
MIINYALSTVPFDDDMESCVSTMTASVFILGDQGEETEVATCDFYIVDLARASNITNCHDLLDLDGSIYHFTKILDDEYMLVDEIEELNDEQQLGLYPEPDRLIVIHELKVKKEHRGNKYSRALIKDFIERFTTDNDLVGLKAYPLENYTEESVTSLRGYYEQCGFVDTGIDDLMLFDSLQRD